MNTKLENCPFCGESESIYEQHVEGTIAHPAYFVKCDNCGAVGPTTDKGNHAELWNRRASPAAAVPEDALPPLPEPCKLTLPTGWIRYTAEQMQAYARAAVEADRAQRPENTDYATALKHIKSMAAAGHSHDAIYEQACSALEAADRAQQGEPVGRAALMEFIDKYCLGNSELVACAESAFYWFNKVATKAAAPADAPIVRPLDDPRMAEYLRGQPYISLYIETLECELRKAKAAAPAPNTGIPTAGEVSIDTPEFREVLDDFAYWASERRAMGGDFGSAEAEEKAEAALIAYIDNFRAPVSSTPTPGAVESEDSMLLDRLDDWLRKQVAAGYECISYPFITSGSVRDQLRNDFCPSEAKAGEYA